MEVTTADDPRLTCDRDGLVVGTAKKLPSWRFIPYGKLEELKKDDAFCAPPKYVDDGIGHYEYWGIKGYDSRIVIEDGVMELRLQCIVYDEDDLERLVSDLMDTDVGEGFEQYKWVFDVTHEEKLTPILVRREGKEDEKMLLADVWVTGEVSC